MVKVVVVNLQSTEITYIRNTLDFLRRVIPIFLGNTKVMREINPFLQNLTYVRINGWLSQCIEQRQWHSYILSNALQQSEYSQIGMRSIALGTICVVCYIR